MQHLLRGVGRTEWCIVCHCPGMRCSPPHPATAMHAAQQRPTVTARCCTAHLATPTVSSRMQHRGCPVQRCQAAQVDNDVAVEQQQQLSRRGALAAGVAASVASMLAAYPAPSAAAAAAATDGFFKYSPTADKTPVGACTEIVM